MTPHKPEKMEKTSLKWNDFHPNVTKSLQRLRHEKDYSGVTLIGDDYQPLFWAHKVVLSSSSESDNFHISQARAQKCKISLGLRYKPC